MVITGQIEQPVNRVMCAGTWVCVCPFLHIHCKRTATEQNRNRQFRTTQTDSSRNDQVRRDRKGKVAVSFNIVGDSHQGSTMHRS